MVAIGEIAHPIRQDWLSGMSFVAIGKKYFIDQRTAKRYALSNLPLEYLDSRPFSSVLDPYKASIDEWLLNDRLFATVIHDRLIEQGCRCGYTVVNDYVRMKIDEYQKAGVYQKDAQVKRDRTSQQEKIMIEKQRVRGSRDDSCEKSR